MSTSLALLELK
jgi:hypothetical protein